MNELTYDANICIMSKVINLMSGKWKPIILYLIRQGIDRFGALQKTMPKISKKILTEQLRELEDDKLVTRTVYGRKAPYVVTYTLTIKGAALRSLMDEMLTWGLVYLKDQYDQKLMEQYNMI